MPLGCFSWFVDCRNRSFSFLLMQKSFFKVYDLTNYGYTWCYQWNGCTEQMRWSISILVHLFMALRFLMGCAAAGEDIQAEKSSVGSGKTQALLYLPIYFWGWDHQSEIMYVLPLVGANTWLSWFLNKRQHYHNISSFVKR